MSPAVLYLALLGWLVAAVPAFALIERRVERTFEVDKHASLQVDTTFGIISVREVADARHIKVTVIQSADAETDEDMERRLRSLELDLQQKPDGAVSVNANFSRGLTWSWKTWPPVSLVYEIEVPKRCDVEIRTGEGEMIIGSLTGKIDLTSDSGSIFVANTEGSVTARSRSGTISITSCAGPIDVSTDTGNITVGRANGRTKLASRGGYIELQRANGEVSVRGNGSDAKVGFVSPVLFPAEISTSGGSISLHLENNSACALDLRASIFGEVRVVGELPLVVKSGGAGKSSLRGDVNAGGARIQARASGGHVVVRGLEPLPPLESAEARQETGAGGDA